jgi:hypothetical protein
MFTTQELTKMRTAQDNHMMDTGRRLVQSRSYDNDYNEPDDSFTPAGSTIKCGLEMKAGNEMDKETMILVQYDAVLRLPIGTTVTPLDRWRIEKRHGESITSIDYQIVSPIQRGPSGLRVLLRKVET